MRNQNRWTKKALGLLTLLGLGTTLHAQSSDVLIDKLVEKGILTVKEAKDLREEADKGFNQAFQIKTGMPDWVKGFKLGGDFRARYEGFYSSNPTAVDRNRFQYRLRYGIAADLLDNFEIGLRIASAGDTVGNPISSNQTLDNNASKKGIALDQVYARWTAMDNPDWSASVTAGKMENPFVFSPIVFDPDYTPEGVAPQFVFHVHPKHNINLNLGAFVLEERSLTFRDSYLLGAQLRLDSKWSSKWATSLGVAGLWITEKSTLTTGNGQLNIGEGNTRVGGAAAGAPLYNFRPIIVSGEVVHTLEEFPLYSGSFPIRLGAEFLHNPSPPTDNEGYSIKLTLGKSGKKKHWELGYEFRELQADAIYEEFPESDFNAFTQTALTAGGTGGFVNGTNIRGHIFKFGYSPYDSLTFFLTYWITENIRENPAGSASAAGRLQVDAVWKF